MNPTIKTIGIVVAIIMISGLVFACGFVGSTMYLVGEHSQAQAVTETASETAEVETAVEQVCTLPSGGEYRFSPNELGEIWQGTEFLAQAKIHGASCTLVVPAGFYAVLNQSAGSVTIDGQTGSLGNPVYLDGETHLTGEIHSSWEANNESAGTLVFLFPEE